MKVVKSRLLVSILIGLVVTVVSGININQNIAGEIPNVRVVEQPLLGASYWGYILPWLRQIIVPGAIKTVMWLNFIADVLVWTIIAYIVLTLLKLPAQPQTKPRRRNKRPARRSRRTARRSR